MIEYLKIFELYWWKNDPMKPIVFVGTFDEKFLFSYFDKYAFVQLGDIGIPSPEDQECDSDTNGMPIFPSRELGSKILLTNNIEVTIIAVAPMLPPHSTVFEYMVMDEEGHIFTVTEPGYIPDKYLFDH